MISSSALLKRRPVVLGAVALVLALAIAGTLAVVQPWAGTKDRDDVAAPAPGDRVLQSVDVAMQADGSLTRVGDTVVIARAQSDRADTYSTTYDPAKVVDQLPVRVLTAYRTDEGSGTDLADLTGFSGRITIDLTVQNLTVQPQEITYDVAGRSETTTALVGAPLTVVASAALPGIDPATIVTAAADAPDAEATNGVLSRASDGTTQVQWASILAPPQLDSTATLRLVVDTKDFVVPAVDLSVQPGLITDPSVGALIDSAFNPKNSAELALETRTIALVGDVNDVLGRASSTISSVRKTLDASSKTLGTKTVQSLTTNTKTISTSLKSSSDNIDSLGDDLRSSLKSTQSTTLQRMSATVSGLQDLIGDTSGDEPKVTVSGTGCSATVEAPSKGGGVYASLLQVIAQLDAYGKTTDGCKAQLQAAISTTIGKTDANGTPICTGQAQSVVCSLNTVRQKFAEVTATIGQGQAAATDLDPGNLSGSLAAVETLSTELALVVRAADVLLSPDPDRDPDPVQLQDIDDALAAAGTSRADAATELGRAGVTLDALGTEVDRIHTEAVANQATVTSMRAQNDELATRLCAVIGAVGAPGTLPAAQVEELRAYLVPTSCPAPDGSTTDLVPPEAYGAALATRLEAQAQSWAAIATASDTSDTDQGLGGLLTDERVRLEAVGTQLAALDSRLGAAEASVAANRGVIQKLRDDTNDIQTGLVQAAGAISRTQQNYAKAKAALDQALADAAAKSDQAATGSVDPAIKQVTDAGTASTAELGKAFDASAAGLAAAADALRDGSAATLKNRQDDLAGQRAADKRELNSQTEAGLARVSGDVTRATRDLDATRKTLTRDLNNVLLDLGSPKTPGKGLLGTLAKSARAADSADFELGLASDTVSSYAAVRSQEVDGILLRQAQAEASLQRQAELPAFATDLDPTTQHRTVYLFRLNGER